MKALCFLWSVIFLSFISQSNGDAVLGIPITRLPFKISKPGMYRLAADLILPQGAAEAITIDANDVVLDFDGYSLTSTGTTSTTWGLAVGINASHVTIRNGTVIGFGVAVEETATAR